MKASFWHHKWENNEIAFHERQANTLLTAHFDKLGLATGSRVFIPLCGKTRDIAWLLSHGYRVVAAELSELAINALFDELGVIPEVTNVGALKHYQATDIDVFVGDIFDLSRDHIGVVDALYDRAALVALPSEIRALYCAHLIELTKNAPQLLITFEYDQSLLPGPPFAISGDEVSSHYTASYQIDLMEKRVLIGGLKGKVDADEVTWLLSMI